MKFLLKILDEVMAEHPEFAPACEFILAKLSARMDAEVAYLRNSFRTHPGSGRKQ